MVKFTSKLLLALCFNKCYTLNDSFFNKVLIQTTNILKEPETVDDPVPIEPEPSFKALSKSLARKKPVISDQEIVLPDGNILTIPGVNQDAFVRLPDMMTSDFAHMNDYGCWCNFKSFSYGKGNPVDYIDTSCKQLFTNYFCLDVNGCDSENDLYTSGMIYFYLAQAIALKTFDRLNDSKYYLDKSYGLCETLNDNDYCKVGVCKAEIRFTYEILPEGLYTGSEPETEFMPNENGFYSNGFVDYDEGQCHSRVNGKGGNGGNGGNGGTTNDYDWECCSDSPDMIRYSLKSEKGCCDNVVYNVISQSCVNFVVNDLFL